MAVNVEKVAAGGVNRVPAAKIEVVDLSQPFSMHTPGWVNYPSPKISYFQRHHTQGVVSQWIETSLHVSTHIDGEMHGTPGGRDIAAMPLDRLVHEGVIVDISDECHDFTWITPEMLTSRMEINKGDIVIINTGWHKYYTHNAEENDVKYFCYHPGGTRELAQWIVDMELSWVGQDTGSLDHIMNTTIPHLHRKDVARAWKAQTGIDASEYANEENWYPMHRIPFPRGIVHAENLGGDIDQLSNTRCLIGAFPWKFIGGESSICRIVAFVGDE